MRDWYIVSKFTHINPCTLLEKCGIADTSRYLFQVFITTPRLSSRRGIAQTFELQSMLELL